MQPIHHTHTRKAEKMGVQLDRQDDMVRALWPDRNLSIFGSDARWALEQMQAAQRIIHRYENEGHEIKLEHDPEKPSSVRVQFNGRWLEGSRPAILWDVSNLKEEPYEFSPEPVTLIRVVDDKLVPFAEDQPHTINGVPTSGRVAHQKGFTIIDNPFLENENEYAARVEWEEEWEESAEEAVAATRELPPNEKTGSVVKVKYRAIYAERGHPTHCGDELANYLNSIVKVGSHTDMGLFEAILAANNVDMSKYNRTNPGWQGRYRMTGRNILAKRVHSNGGLLYMPESINGGEPKQMSQGWVQSQRFK